MVNNLTNLLLSIRITDVIDIVIVAYIFYALLGMIKETRAQQLFRGVLLIVVVFLASELFDLSLLNWLLTRLITVGLIGVIILFQPEIRRGLEQIGRRGILTSTFRDIGREEVDHIAERKHYCDPDQSFDQAFGIVQATDYDGCKNSCDDSHDEQYVCPAQEHVDLGAVTTFPSGEETPYEDEEADDNQYP